MYLVVLFLLIVVYTSVRVVRLVVRDGYGSTPPPRSHPEELGTWVDRELGR